MALTKKERQKMGDAMMVTGTVRAAKELYDIAKPIVKKGVEKGKEAYKKHKEKKEAKKAAKKKGSRKYHNNNYKEGE
jgi:hypothetical protein